MKALMILASTAILAILMADFALSQSISLGGYFTSYGGYAEVDNHISGFSDHAAIQKGNFSYGSMIQYETYATNIEYLTPPPALEKDNANRTDPTYNATLISVVGRVQQILSQVLIEDASGGSYSMVVNSPGQARQNVHVSNLSNFNASNLAFSMPGRTNVNLSMNGTGDYRSQIQVLGGAKGHPIGEGSMKIIGSTFEINSTMRYIL
jgi:hypothetical protein